MGRRIKIQLGCFRKTTPEWSCEFWAPQIHSCLVPDVKKPRCEGVARAHLSSLLTWQQNPGWNSKSPFPRIDPLIRCHSPAENLLMVFCCVENKQVPSRGPWSRAAPGLCLSLTRVVLAFGPSPRTQQVLSPFLLPKAFFPLAFKHPQNCSQIRFLFCYSLLHYSFLYCSNHNTQLFYYLYRSQSSFPPSSKTASSLRAMTLTVFYIIFCPVPVTVPSP